MSKKCKSDYRVSMISYDIFPYPIEYLSKCDETAMSASRFPTSRQRG